MKTITAYLLLSILCVNNYYGQDAPCYKRKRICAQRSNSDCRSLVSFDPESKTYFVKNDFGSLYSGTCIVCHRNGVLQEKVTIVNGKRDGIDTSYYPSGCPQSIQKMILGELHGEIVEFYDSTERASKKINFYNGMFNGPYILFENNKNNDTTYLETYAFNKLNGDKVQYFNDSKREKLVQYKNGLLHGSHITYDRNGSILSNYEYFEGKKHGEWSIYYANDILARRENWQIGLKNGEFLSINQFKDTIDVEHFKEDKLHGLQMRRSNSKDTSFFKVYFNDSLIYGYSKNNFGEKTILVPLNKKTAKIIIKKKDIRVQLPKKFIDFVRYDLKNKKFKKKKKKKKNEKKVKSDSSETKNDAIEKSNEEDND